MPITLNNSNISVQYNTGSNYIIETVKSDLYVRGTTSGNLSSEPTVSPSIRTGNIEVETFTYTTGTTQTTYTKVFSQNTLCDILIVGGGGGGDGFVGGGGGGGAVLYATGVEIPAGSYAINVGKGGTPSVNGSSSQAFGATCLGGGSTVDNGWGEPTNGRSGGSGSGGSAGYFGYPGGIGGGVGISTKGTLLNSGTLYNGNIGGNGLVQGPVPVQPVCSGGGGGAGSAGKNSISVQYTTRQQWIDAGKPGSGGDGIPINITGTTYYWGAGGGGSSYNTHAGDGGLGGGGGGGAGTIAGLAGTGGINNGNNGTNGDVGGNAGNGTGSGGGGGSTAGSGGSGIVIVKYKYTNDSKRYRLHFPRKTKVEFILNGDGNRITSNDLQGTYIITITSTKIFIEKEGGGPNNKQEFPSNKIEIIYDLFDTLDNINSTFTDSLTTTKSKPINVYNNTLSSINNGFPFQLNKYNKYKISGFIPKANKNGDNNINFNIDLTVPDPNDTSRLIDMSKDLYSIRYNFQYLQSENEITPIDIYITIKPLPGVINDTISYFAFKTYFRSGRSGLNSSEIQVFLSNTLSIDKFNEISDWITNLNNKNIWGLSNMDKEISDIIRNLLSVDNIDNKCKNDNTANDLRICDIRKLIYIKNKINGTSVSSTGSPRLIQNVSIVSQNVFPRNSPYVNFNIDEYISYESSTLIAPQQRTTTFDIKSTATKYMYFYMGQVS